MTDEGQARDATQAAFAHFGHIDNTNSYVARFLTKTSPNSVGSLDVVSGKQRQWLFRQSDDEVSFWGVQTRKNMGNAMRNEDDIPRIHRSPLSAFDSSAKDAELVDRD